MVSDTTSHGVSRKANPPRFRWVLRAACAPKLTAPTGRGSGGLPRLVE